MIYDISKISENEKKLYHFAGVEPIVFALHPVLGAGYAINFIKTLVQAKRNVAYLLKSFSFSLNCSETIFQDALMQPIEFTISNSTNGSSFFPSAYKTVLFQRDFENSQIGYNSTAGDMQARFYNGFLQQTAELSTIDLKVFYNFSILEISSSQWISDNLQGSRGRC